MNSPAEYLADRDLKSLREWLTNAAPLEVAEELTHTAADSRALMFRLLPKERSLAVFEILDPSIQQDIISELRESWVREIMEAMEPDDRARLLDELPTPLAKSLLQGLSPKERKLTALLLGYPEDSVGRIMSPEYVELQDNLTAAEALAQVRRSGVGIETIYSLPVVDAQARLKGVLELGDLVLAAPDSPVAELIAAEPYHAQARDDAEEAAQLLLDAGLIALPILSDQEQLVGVLTFDDAMEVLQERDTEDIQLSAASQPLDAPYLSVSLLELTRSRAGWLLLLTLAATLTVNVLSFFEEALTEVLTLSLFIPLLIGIGGNIGAQSATIIVRAMALGELRYSSFMRVLLRELRVGTLLGLSIGLIGFLPVTWIFGRDFALILLLSLLTIATLAATLGSALPMLAKKLGVDPAVVSAPIITTLLDASGLVVYFLIAKAVLGI